MPRHMKLIWLILEYASENDTGVSGKIQIPEFEDYSREQVEHHLKLCEEAGYLELSKERTGYNRPNGIRRVKWAGYEALEHRGRT